MILAIDPGPEQSAYVLYDNDTRTPVEHGKIDNFTLLRKLGSWHAFETHHVHELAIEMIASYGMPVGREVFETCVVIGRILHAWEDDDCATRVYRSEVKTHLCGSVRAKDANVRQALLDAFGGKEKAVGSKKQPGPLYGVKADVWSALAVAITLADRLDQERLS